MTPEDERVDVRKTAKKQGKMRFIIRRPTLYPIELRAHNFEAAVNVGESCRVVIRFPLLVD